MLLLTRNALILTKKITYMLDTNICSFIMRENPLSVLQRLQVIVGQQHRIVISAITYQEMQMGLIGRKALPKRALLVEEFIKRIDAILPWDKDAVDAAITIKCDLAKKGTPIGNNDSLIAGHAVAMGCVLVTNNIREFNRVDGLTVEDWVH